MARSYMTKQWWDKAEDWSPKAFYVDYNDAIWDPSVFSKEEFDDAFRHISRLHKQTEKWIDKIEGMNDSLFAGGRHFMKIRVLPSCWRIPSKETMIRSDYPVAIGIFCNSAFLEGRPDKPADVMVYT
jgi:hypothetical protein